MIKLMGLLLYFPDNCKGEEGGGWIVRWKTLTWQPTKATIPFSYCDSSDDMIMIAHNQLMSLIKTTLCSIPPLP